MVRDDSAKTPAPDAPTRTAQRLAVLGDSTAVGLGDPLPGGGWRGVGPLAAEALGITPDGYLNCSFTGARMRCVRTEQLPVALAHRPDVVLLVAGMNDTLRSDFDPAKLAADLDRVLAALLAEGALPVVVCFHDHGRVFRLPGALRRALRARIGELNAAIGTAVTRHEVPCLDLDAVPGTYDLASWSVDRLHPSELGHRLLARGFTELLSQAGFAVPAPVGLTCSGGAQTSTLDHVGWLVVKGAPWLWRRGRDLLPYAAGIILRSMAGRAWRPRREAGTADTEGTSPQELPAAVRS
ncbi:SGNH/GDSL hydrolase family protein [Saccharomonospora sp. NPDC046836]|uniref:SGNH/GDSL hydrolase family protein n=1 Tax=Saccharomonospora sp. NPDC046836 TaxID=3156921 RepID=UPI0033F56614